MYRIKVNGYDKLIDQRTEEEIRTYVSENKTIKEK